MPWRAPGREPSPSRSSPEAVPYSVLVSRGADRDFRRLPPDIKERIRAAMEALTDDPRRHAEKLVVEGTYRVRVGNCRIVFRVDDTAREVLVVRIKHRREVYRR